MAENPVSVFSENSPFKAIEFSPEEVQFVYDRHGGDAEETLAKTAATLLNNMPEYQGMADYTDLMLGTAPILDMVPLPPEERGKAVTDDQILRLFTSMKGLGDPGAPTETDAFLSGLTRGTFSLAGGVLGAKGAVAAAPPYVPLPGPLAPLGVFSKPVAGVGGFLGGAVLGDLFIGSPLSRQMFTGLEDVQLTPAAEAAYRGFESGGNIAPMLLSLPFLAPKAALSTASHVKNLPLANQVTVLSADDMANPMVTKYLAGKVAGAPTTRQFLTLRDKIFREAKEAGQEITLKEAAKQAAQELNRSGALVRGTSGFINFAEKALVSGGQSFRALSPGRKAGFLGLEATAIPITGALVNLQETEAPRSPGYRVAAETVGGLAPNLFLLKNFFRVKDAMGGYITRVRENRAMGKPLDIFGTKERAKGRAIADIYDIFDDHKEDPDAFLAAMEELMVDPVLDSKGNITGYKIKPSFAEKVGENPDTVFSGQFINSAAIQQLEQTVLARGSGGMSAKFDADFLKSMELQKAQIFAMKGSGDPALVKLAGEMMKDRISMLIGMRAERAIQNTIEAVRKVYPDGGPEASELLGKRLAEVMKTQKDLFRRLERNAWNKVDRNKPIETFFRRADDFDETGDYVESDLPNFIEEWDATLADMDPLQVSRLLEAPGFKTLNDRILDLKSQLGIASTDQFAAPLAPVVKFNEAYANTMGLGARTEYRRLLVNAGLIDDVRPRVDQLSETLSNDAVDAFNENIAAPARGFNPNDPKSLRAMADDYDGMAAEEMKIVNQAPDDPAMVRMAAGAQQMQDQARLLRARADDIENPIDTEAMPTIEPTQANIEALGQIENRLGRQKSRSLDLVKLHREALIAQLGEQQATAATGVVREPLTQGNLTALYQDAREIARSQQGVNDNYKRIANNLAAAALDDLNAGPYGNPDYDAARDISYAYNEYLKRTFGGDIISKNSRGMDVVNDALITDKLMSGKPDALSLRIGQVQKIGLEIQDYAQRSGYDIVSEAEVAGYMGTTEEVLLNTLRLAVKEIELPIEARTLRTPEAIALAQNEAMQQFRAKHPKVMQMFPRLGVLMDESQDAATFLQRVQKQQKVLETKVKNQKAFQKLTGAENPEAAITAALSSDTPMAELDSLIKVLRLASNPRRLQRYIRNNNLDLSPEDFNYEAAREGLRTTILGLAFSKGGKYSAQGLNARGAYDLLFDLIPKAERKSENTLAKWMVKNEIFSETEAANLEEGLRIIIQSETKQDVSKALITGETPALIDMYTRILGSRLGTTIGGAMPGGRASAAGLIEAEAGSRYLRKLTQEIPALQEYDALEQILLDPTLLALALRKPRTKAEKTGIINILLDKVGTGATAAAPAAGRLAIPLSAMEITEPEQSGEIPLAPAADLDTRTEDLQQRAEELIGDQSSAAQVTPTQLFPDLPTTDIASVSPSMNPVGQGSVNRARFAALFPEDRALIEGIGSLG